MEDQSSGKPATFSDWLQALAVQGQSGYKSVVEHNINYVLAPRICMCISSAGFLTLRCRGLVIWPSTQPLHVRSRRSSSRSRRLHVHHEYVSCTDLQIHVLSHRLYVRSGSYSFGSIIGGRGLASTVWAKSFFFCSAGLKGPPSIGSGIGSQDFVPFTEISCTAT